MMAATACLPPTDPERLCLHRPDQTYTRQPCSCGRPLWPPRGRGRGESLYSPRRIAAKLRAGEAFCLALQGESYAEIARQLGYKTGSGAYRACQRMRALEAAWREYERFDEAETGHRHYARHRPTRYELEQALARLQARIEGSDLDQQRREDALARLAALLMGQAKRWAHNHTNQTTAGEEHNEPFPLSHATAP